MVVRVHLVGLDKTRKFMIKLPKILDKELSKTNQDFIDDVVAEAKGLAPVDTGHLKESIKSLPVQKMAANVKRWKVVVEAEHGIFQEEGFVPHFAFIRNSSKFAPGRRYVSKWTPFLKPALNRVQNKYLNMLSVSTKRAIVKSGG